jgi:hypothetical protein
MTALLEGPAQFGKQFAHGGSCKSKRLSGRIRILILPAGREQATIAQPYSFARNVSLHLSSILEEHRQGRFTHLLRRRAYVEGQDPAGHSVDRDTVPASWEAMTGDDRVRFCGECRRHVYHLSELSRSEAEALIERAEGRICVRFYRRADGKIMTSDCPVGLQAARRRLALAVGAGVAMLLVASGWGLALLGRHSRDTDVGSWGWRDIEPIHTLVEWISPTPPPIVMGMVCPVEQPVDPPVDIFDQDRALPSEPPTESPP